jgi:hypothetical protein
MSDDLGSLDFPINPDDEEHLRHLDEGGETFIEIGIVLPSAEAQRVLRMWDNCDLHLPADFKAMGAFVTNFFELIRDALASPVQILGEEDEEDE